jgi:hypothetical protein
MIHVRTSGIHHKSASRFFSSKDAEEDVTRECTRQREWQKILLHLASFLHCDAMSYHTLDEWHSSALSFIFSGKTCI